jgi:hypothetical protein
MTQPTINRRKALTVVATAPVALALGVPAFAIGGPGQLAGLVRRYFHESDAFNAIEHTDDGEMNALAAATYEKTVREMVGVPARNAEDARAAIGWLIREGDGCRIDDEGTVYDRAAASLIHAVKDYLASIA